MKNTEIRRILEAEILRLGKTEEALSKDGFDKYYGCLSGLLSVDISAVSEQEKIYAAAYGDIGGFVLEFLKYVSPFVEKRGKNILFKSVLDTRTTTLFSPRLTEIALGCMLSAFLSRASTVYLSVFSTKTHAVISAGGSSVCKKRRALHCINKIARLHSGRIICCFCAEYNQIFLTFPLSPTLEPIKLIPCVPTLCRLCRV